jgi:hypothetical protein
MKPWSRDTVGAQVDTSLDDPMFEEIAVFILAGELSSLISFV